MTHHRTTHESFILIVRDLACARLNDDHARNRALAAKIVYGSGASGTRGVCYFNAWAQEAACDLVEVCAFGEESPLQLVGTTLHELAHVIAGHAAGHGTAWRAAAAQLGLRQALAAGQTYEPRHFDPAFLDQVKTLNPPNEMTELPSILAWRGQEVCVLVLAGQE